MRKEIYTFPPSSAKKIIPLRSLYNDESEYVKKSSIVIALRERKEIESLVNLCQIRPLLPSETLPHHLVTLLSYDVTSQLVTSLPLCSPLEK